MFKQIIRNTQLTTDAANSFFQHISGESFQRDVSFLSTLRALVAPRLKEGESVHLSFYHSNYTAGFLSQFSTKNAVKHICDDLDDYVNGQIIIHNIAGSPEDSRYCTELLRSTLTSVFPEWHIMEKVTDFYKKAFQTLCFVNPDKRGAIIFVEDLDIRKMHYLQCSIFAFMPWYFDPKLGVSKLEMELIESLRGKDYERYENCIAEIAEQYDFRSEKIRRLLKGFETNCEKRQCEEVKHQIKRYIEAIEGHNRQIGDYLKAKAEQEIKLLGLEAKIANNSDDSEIMEYFLHNDKLVLERVESDYMVFVVRTYLEYYDEDAVSCVLNNKTSYIYRPLGSPCAEIISPEDIHMLMTAIFIEQKLRIRFCAAYQFSMNGSVSALTNYGFGSECREYMPNPHIDKYNCLGNYQRVINELLVRRDYIGAIEQCLASCKSLNFSDSPVMCEFMKKIYGMNNLNNKCVELPDGNVVTPINAIEWLKAQEVKTNE